jgi:hypothetical protein
MSRARAHGQPSLPEQIWARIAVAGVIPVREGDTLARWAHADLAPEEAIGREIGERIAMWFSILARKVPTPRQLQLR